MKDHRPQQIGIMRMSKQSTTLSALTLVATLAAPLDALAISPTSYLSLVKSSNRLTDLIVPEAISTDAVDKMHSAANTYRPEITLIAKETANSSSDKTSDYSDSESATSSSNGERPSAVNTYSSLWRWLALLPFLAVFLGSFLDGGQEDFVDEGRGGSEYPSEGTSASEEGS